MTKTEKKRLDVISKQLHILRVVGSCNTAKQLENAKEWGFKTINRVYKDTYGDNSFCDGTIQNKLYMSDFNNIKKHVDNKSKST